MHPSEVIEFILVGGAIAVTVIVSLFLKGRPRKSAWILAFVIFLSYSVFFIARPYWIDTQIEKRVELLEPYLAQQYPNEEWTIQTVPHREEGYRHLHPYQIGVVFEDEPEVSYQYWIDEGDINQNGYYTDEGVDIDELKYKEME